MRWVLLVLIAGVSCLYPAIAGDAETEAMQNWPAWRGPLNNGTAPNGNPPVEWSETKNVRWKVKIGGLGSSTPIIWGDRVYVTTAIDTGKKASKGADNRPDSERRANPGGTPPEEIYRFEVVALERADGSEAWRTVVNETNDCGSEGRC